MVNERAAQTSSQEQLLDGRYRVGKLLHESETGAVHETEYGDDGIAAVIRIRRGDTEEARRMAGLWRKAMELDHPNLLRMYAAGSATLFDVPVVYAVMERADESLASVLAERALSEAEVREMLAPTIAALRYLHKNGYTHAALKPSNILARGNQLKLSICGIRPIGEEASPVDDMWGLGEVIVQALTRKRPKVIEELGPYILREASQPFTDVVRHCLDPDAYRRWNLDQVEARLGGRAALFVPPVVKVVPIAEPAGTPGASSPEAPAKEAAPPRQEPPKAIVMPLREPAREPLGEIPKPASGGERRVAPERRAFTETERRENEKEYENEDAPSRRLPRWSFAGFAALALVVGGTALLRTKPAGTAPAAASLTPAFSEGSAAPGAPATPEAAPASRPFSNPAEAAPVPAAPVRPAPEAKAVSTSAGARKAQGWSVIVAAYNARGPAEKRQQQMAHRWRKFNLGVQEAQPGKSLYFVVLGQNLSEDQATALRKRAVASGLPRDTYIKRLIP